MTESAPRISPMITARELLERIPAMVPEEGLRILNVCGGHERTISQAGLRSLLPERVKLIPGPGCPVCVCPEEDVYAAIQLSLLPGVLVVAFGDMLRVPVNGKAARSLEEARALGGAVLPIASPLEAVALARSHPLKQVVFFAAGFETTCAPVAAMLAEGVPDNLSVLLSGRRTCPAVALLLSLEQRGFNALIAPGHVATVMGPEEWGFVSQQHGLPSAVAGFTPDSLLAAIYAIAGQARLQQPALDNCYPRSVHPGGNPGAKRLLNEHFVVEDGPWRGIGVIPQSVYRLADSWDGHNARLRFPEPFTPSNRPHAGEMPPGCDCAAVILGQKEPSMCRLYGTACTPRHPVGPCMVSDEGACRIWWADAVR